MIIKNTEKIEGRDKEKEERKKSLQLLPVTLCWKRIVWVSIRIALTVLVYDTTLFVIQVKHTLVVAERIIEQTTVVT